MKTLVVGTSAPGALEISYYNAFRGQLDDVSFFDYNKVLNKYIKGKKLGSIFNSFVPVEQWIRKMNRELIVEVNREKPEVIVFFAKSKILFGTLACIKTIHPKIKIVWIWPDTPMNLERYNLENAPFIDLFCTYSSATVNVFKQLGYSNIIFLPLGADDRMHHVANQPNTFANDIGFVGGWRPEREKIMSLINENFGYSKIAIHGPNWLKNIKDQNLKSKIKSDGLYSNQLSDFFNKTRININVIDDTNYPAANMRFFEIPIANALQLSSTCPEMEETFIDKKDLCYFKDDSELVSIISNLLKSSDQTQIICNNGYIKTKDNHTYNHRVATILLALNNL